MFVEAEFFGRPESAIELPLINAACGALSRTMRSAMSEGGVHWLWSACGMSYRFFGVSMMNGIRQSAVTPVSRSSSAMLSVSRITALFATA